MGGWGPQAMAMLQSMGPFAHWADAKARKNERAVTPSKEDDYNGHGQYDSGSRTRFRPPPTHVAPPAWLTCSTACCSCSASSLYYCIDPSPRFIF